MEGGNGHSRWLAINMVSCALRELLQRHRQRLGINQWHDRRGGGGGEGFACNFASYSKFVFEPRHIRSGCGEVSAEAGEFVDVIRDYGIVAHKLKEAHSTHFAPGRKTMRGVKCASKKGIPTPSLAEPS